MTEIDTGQVPRGATMRRTAGSGRFDRARGAQPNGWWGMVLFLCSEVTLFGTLLGSYFYLDFGSRRWPPPGISAPAVTLPVIATAALVALTPVVLLAGRAGRRGARGRAMGSIAFVMAVQCGYLAAQVLLFRHDLLHFTPQATAYGSIYFTILAAHHAHVLFGILLDGVVLYKLAAAGLTDYWVIGVRGLVLYWLVVNVLAIVVLLTILSPSL